jgi:hypothetical protein
VNDGEETAGTISLLNIIHGTMLGKEIHNGN